MKVDSNVIFDMTSGSAKVYPEATDATPSIPSSIVPTCDTIMRTMLNPTTGSGLVEQDTGYLASSLRNVPASSGATNANLCILPKGCYTITVSISGRFVGTPAPTGNVDAFIDLTNANATNSAILVGLYAQTLTNPTMTARFRVVLTEQGQLRARNLATAVGQTMELMFSASVERHL